MMLLAYYNKIIWQLISCGRNILLMQNTRPIVAINQPRNKSCVWLVWFVQISECVDYI